MVIIEDTRQQPQKHKAKHEWFETNGIEIYRSKLEVGDYSLAVNRSLCIDTKKDLQELCGNVCQQHKRFAGELERAQKLGIQLIVLCEHGPEVQCLEDIKKWKNPRRKYSPQALTGEKLFKILHTMEIRHGCRFEFCNKEDAGRRIVELLSQK